MLLLLKNLLFTVLVPGTVGVYLPLLIARRGAGPTLPLVLLAVPVLALGTAIYAWCLWNFAVTGRGTPLPIDAPKKLVVRGLYRYTRNPMYLAVITVVIGWTILFQAVALALYALAVATAFHLMVVFYEEPHLGRRFGQEYTEYRARVGRWLPRPRRAG